MVVVVVFNMTCVYTRMLIIIKGTFAKEGTVCIILRGTHVHVTHVVCIRDVHV